MLSRDTLRRVTKLVLPSGSSTRPTTFTVFPLTVSRQTISDEHGLDGSGMSVIQSPSLLSI
jgi:hypothetical protein